MISLNREIKNGEKFDKKLLELSRKEERYNV